MAQSGQGLALFFKGSQVQALIESTLNGLCVCLEIRSAAAAYDPAARHNSFILSLFDRISGSALTPILRPLSVALTSKKFMFQNLILPRILNLFVAVMHSAQYRIACDQRHLHTAGKVIEAQCKASSERFLR